MAFFAVNVWEMEDGGGYVFLLIMFIMGVLEFIFSFKSIASAKINKSVAWIVVFIIYEAINLIIDYDNFLIVKAQIFGTTSGLLFFIIFGYCASVKYKRLIHLYRSENNKKFLFVSILLYLMINLIVYSFIFQNYLAGIREDVFLIKDQIGSYQRPANFMLVQFIINSFLLALVISENKFKILSYAAIGIHILTAILFSALAQLIGSNLGFLSVLGFCLLYFNYLFVFRRVLISKNLRLEVLIFKLKKRYIHNLALLLIVCLTSSMLLAEYAIVDFSQYRFSGFGSGEISSIESRLYILKNNFVDQFTYSPIFGNTQVDVLTSGEGTYVHSIISLLTHVGLIGFFLFMNILISLLKESFPQHHDENFFYYLNFLKIMTLMFMVMVCLFATFYTWPPLIFMMGFASHKWKI
jgi:hypothetical protein